MSAPAPAIRENAQLDLAALRRLKYDELERLYRAARRPSALSDLNGDAVGAMLEGLPPDLLLTLIKSTNNGPASGRPRVRMKIEKTREIRNLKACHDRSVTAPRLLLDTSFAYFASTPEV